MSRRIDLDPRGLLRIEFPYDRGLLDVVRALPQRRFDRDDRAWYVPTTHLEVVIGRLHPLKFALTEALLAHCDAVGADPEAIVAAARPQNRAFIDEASLPAGTWTVATLNERAREVLHETFREELWVAAEIQGYDRNRRDGHAFFELVHRPFAGADPSARLPAVLWSQERATIEQLLVDDGAQVRLRDGLIVRLLVKADFYSGQGRFQVSARDIDLACTSGTLVQNREQILRQLEQQGILTLNSVKPWPLCPMRVGLITSDESDACLDFLHELGRGQLGFEVTLHHAQVQGAHAEASILRALAWFAARASEFDALAIVRGGGARSDLAYFDTLAIGQAVCQHPLKIIVGIGHQRDQCLLDLVTHSEKTPTAAAQFFVQRARDYRARVDELWARIEDHARDVLLDARRALQHAGEGVGRVAGRVVERERRRLERAAYGVSAGAGRRVERERLRLDRVGRAIPARAQRELAILRERVESAERRMEPARLTRPLQEHRRALTRAQDRLTREAPRVSASQRRELAQIQERLRLLDPARVLERGFAIVRHQGRALRDSATLSPDDSLDVQLSAGRVQARVIATQDDTPDPEEP